MAWYDSIVSALVGSTADPRSRENQQLDRARVHQYNQAYQQYNQALSNPNFGIPAPEDVANLEKNIVDKVFNARSAAGGGFTPMNNVEAGKYLAEFRLGLLEKQQRARESLFQGLTQLLGGPRSEGPTSTPGFLQRAGTEFGNAAITRATGSVLDKWFPKSPQPTPSGGGQPAVPGYTEQSKENQSPYGV